MLELKSLREAFFHFYIFTLLQNSFVHCFTPYWPRVYQLLLNMFGLTDLNESCFRRTGARPTRPSCLAHPVLPPLTTLRIMRRTMHPNLVSGCLLQDRKYSLNLKTKLGKGTSMTECYRRTHNLTINSKQRQDKINPELRNRITIFFQHLKQINVCFRK